MKRLYTGNLRIISGWYKDVIVPFSCEGNLDDAWEKIERVLIDQHIWTWDRIRLEDIKAEWINEEEGD